MLTQLNLPARAAPIVQLDEVDSTNAEALRRAAIGERGPLWLMTRRQTRGRGRSGRSWQSAPGNLAATLLFAPGCPLGILHQLSLLTGVAVHDGISDLTREASAAAGQLALKWPNDILVDGAKLGGILIESTTFGATTVAAIGIGVNVASAPIIGDRASACLAELGIAVPARKVLDAISAALVTWLARWDRGRNFDEIRRAWLERTTRDSGEMTINAGEGPVAGIFAGLDETGALLLDCTGAVGQQRTTRRFTFGDVTLASERSADRGKS